MTEDQKIALKEELESHKYSGLFPDNPGMAAILLNTEDEEYYAVADPVAVRQSVVIMVAPNPTDGLLLDHWMNVINEGPGEDEASVQKWLLAKSLYRTYHDALPINFQNPVVQQMTELAVDTGLISKEQLDVIKNDSIAYRSAAQRILGRHASISDVVEAWNG